MTGICSVLFIHFLFQPAMRMDRWATQASTRRTPASIERSYESSATKQPQDERLQKQYCCLNLPSWLRAGYLSIGGFIIGILLTTEHNIERKYFQSTKSDRYPCVFTLANHTLNIVPGLLIQYTFLKVVVCLSVQLTDCLGFFFF